jgi:hypothetical protein
MQLSVRYSWQKQVEVIDNVKELSLCGRHCRNLGTISAAHATAATTSVLAELANPGAASQAVTG